MDVVTRREFERLGAQILALETLFSSLLSVLRESGTLDIGSLGKVFADADLALETCALQNL
jgi:hypothetical protein